MSKKPHKKSGSEDNTIALNRKARHEYFIEEQIEAGIVLEGWEVKSIREGRIQISESYVILKNNAAWLLGSHISPLKTASTHINPVPDRTRKLLLHRKEVSHLSGSIERKGFTVVALSMYWKKNRVKLNIGLAKGKKTHDKRESIKQREWQRDKARIMKERN